MRLRLPRRLLLAVLLAACGAGQSAAPPAADDAWIAATQPITGSASDHDAIVRAAEGARFVLLGESTHGTHEYYVERARLTRRLIAEQGFNAVAIEGDWSATARVNLYVRGGGSDRSAEQALSGYTSFPRWMWRNRDFRDFVEALRAYNLTVPEERRVGLYGMDVYDLFDAAKSALAYLREADPAAAARAEKHYRCFERFRGSVHAYGEAARRPARSCEKQAGEVLADLRRMARPKDPARAERHFAAIRSAASVAGGEEYFRTVYAGSLAWNVRDRRMADNVEEIAEHLAAVSGRPGKVVVWAHNTHSGDARATFAANRGEHNVGQLLRQRHGRAAFLVGLVSYSGTVTAAPEWDSPGRTYAMKRALPGSYSDLFHRAGLAAFSLLLRDQAPLARRFGEPRLERAIGVVYQPQNERLAHYFEARLSEQFDAVLFFDRSTAVQPLMSDALFLGFDPASPSRKRRRVQ